MAPSLPLTIDAELDEVLSLLPMLDVVPRLEDRVFSRLVDVLARAALHDLCAQHEAGELDRATYVRELCELVTALQEREILTSRPPPG